MVNIYWIFDIFNAKIVIYSTGEVVKGFGDRRQNETSNVI